jgi:hypothetical protein
MRRLALTPKLLTSFAVIGAAASIAGLGTYATFTSSTSAQNQALTSGTVSLTIGAANRLAVGATNLVPGDTIQRAIDINNNGSAGTSQVGSITLTTTAAPSSLLDADTVNGLQMNIDSCSKKWDELGPPYTYSSSGTSSVVLASRPAIGSSIALSNVTALTAGNTDHLRVTLTLPAVAGNALQGLSSTISYVFTALQRAAGSS